jgi:hypothetical protein
MTLCHNINISMNSVSSTERIRRWGSAMHEQQVCHWKWIALQPIFSEDLWAEVDSHWIFRLFLIVDIRKSRDYAYFGNTHILQLLDYAFFLNMHIWYQHDYAYFRNMHLRVKIWSIDFFLNIFDHIYPKKIRNMLQKLRFTCKLFR